MYNYTELKNKIENNQSRGLNTKKIANNTYARLSPNSEMIIVKYHDSDICQLWQDKIILHSCGYKTLTTKERLNWFIPNNWNIYQSKYIWYIWNCANKSEYIYKDGLTFNLINGQWELDLNTVGDKNELRRIKGINKRINKYAADFIRQLFRGKIDKPGAGDCLYCQFNDVESGKNIGELTNNLDHIESHISEHYYVPSLLVNAIKTFPVSIIANNILYTLWYEDDNNISWGENIAKDQIKSSLIKYLRRLYKIS